MASVNNTRSIRVQELRASRKALPILSDDKLHAQVQLGAHLLGRCSLLRLAGDSMRAHQVAMPSPLGERNLPNLFPDLDSLAVEFSSKLMGQLREAWSATGLQAEMVEKNAIAIGLMLPFWRVGSLLELHELGWLTEIHLCDRSPKGELARLLEQWRKPDQTEGKVRQSLHPRPSNVSKPTRRPHISSTKVTPHTVCCLRSAEASSHEDA